ncbi:DUF488 family protein [Mycoplana sp. MJR14]|uniref:DUF488 domain-containing protein n=1 Tax=Mycoplana sp. MJR14 TaxID=3032583 RepID=UPI0023DB9458|nr:DUF488 family protein [Mycoplana sp. MJR14]MDF1633550.1 DUF488 family protein [Mycoplana sp. MJR14]
MTVRIKRVYDAPEASDGMRILVDRLWPRGIAKEKARIDLWLKDISPSDDLRRRFHARPESWDEFRTLYAEELEGDAGRIAAAELRRHIAEGPVTLLYAARDEQHNNAAALKLWLEENAPKPR